MLRIRDAYQDQLNATGQLLLSQTLAEAETRVACWEAIIADPQWDHVFPIVQVLSLDYLAIAHLDQSRWDASSHGRTRALAAWQSIMAGFPDVMAVRNCYLQIQGVPADQRLTTELLSHISAGSEQRVNMGLPPDQPLGPQRPGAPLRKLLRPHST